jgi:hypothetical protein
MRAMTEPPSQRPSPPPPDAPGERPPKRLLDRAPSERLAASSGLAGSAGPTEPTRAGSFGAALALGLLAAAGGALVHVVVATALGWTGGLLVVAASLGIVVGMAVAFGARGSLPAVRRRSLAMGLALGGLVVAIAVNWALSGMYLGPLDYVIQVYGLLVPLQALLAALGALAGAR